MSIVRVSELGQVTGVTPNSLFLTSYGESNPRQSKYITKQDLLGQYATTGSNTFLGTENITGSLNVSGSIDYHADIHHIGTKQLTGSLFVTGSSTQIGDNTLKGNSSLSGSVGITGSLTITDIPIGSPNDSALVINPITHVVSYVQQNQRTVYGLFSQTGNSITISGTTVETTLIDGGIGSLIIPANGFKPGDSFRADLGGILSAQNNDTIRIRVKAANTGMLLGDSGIQTLSSVTNNVWTLSLNFIIRQVGTATVASTCTLGRFSYAKTVNGTVEGFSFNTVNTTTFDTTVQTELIITAEFGSSSNNNVMYSDMFILNKIF
jgi:hypothetical protein